MKPVKTSVPAGTFGFSFRLRANGVAGGTVPKTYALNNSNKLLTGQVSEFDAFETKIWPSDPGDNVLPQTTRDYGPSAPPGITNDGLCPNNVRLSQVPIESLVSSFGIGPGLVQRNLPTSTNYNNSAFNTNFNPAVITTLANFCGIKRIRLQIIDPAPVLIPVVDPPTVAALVLVNGGYLLSSQLLNYVEFEESNLGAIGIVNLGIECTVGVTAEMNL